MDLALLLPFQSLIAMRVLKQISTLVLHWWKNSFKCSVKTAETKNKFNDSMERLHFRLNMKGCSEDPGVGSVTIFSDSMDRLIIK